MQHSLMDHVGLSWPFIVLVAWFVGEVGFQITRIPRISFYILCGFLFFNNKFGISANLSTFHVNFLINIAIGLILFEFGHRINLNWLKNNPKIILTGLLESLATFVVIFVVSKLFSLSTMASLEFATLSIATSPIIVMYIVNQNQSSGQVTERILHLSAINSFIAIFLFKLVFGLVVFQKSGNILQATWTSILMVMFSVILGILFAVILSFIMAKINIIAYDRTVAFAIFVISLVVVAVACNLSPFIAVLIFSIFLRHKRVAIGKTQRNFGALGELLTVILFIFIPSVLHFGDYTLTLWVSVTLILARILTKVIVVGFCSYFDGLSWSKSFLVGFALTPISVFSILILEPSKYAGVSIFTQLSSLAVVFLLLEIISPIITQYALGRAKENLT